MEETRICVFCGVLKTKWVAENFRNSRGECYHKGCCVCGNCATKHLTFSKELGSFCLKPGRVIPPVPSPSGSTPPTSVPAKLQKMWERYLGFL